MKNHAGYTLAPMPNWIWRPERIAAFRAALDRMSQEDLVKALFHIEGVDVTRQTVASWESGKTSPDIQPNVIALANILANGDVSAFFDIIEDRHGKNSGKMARRTRRKGT